MSYSYANPGTWSYGVTVSKGDVFQVTASDSKINSNYREGDFYKAKFDGDIADQYYPERGQSNDDWDFDTQKNHYTYDNPGSWGNNVLVLKDDVFQVNANDIITNTHYREGDFYTAQFDGYIGDKKYPTDGKSDNYWRLTSGWTQSANIKIDFPGSPQLYSNGMNMIPVFVTLKPEDDSKEVVSITDEELMSAITLCDWGNNTNLTFIDTPPPSISNGPVHKPGSYPLWEYYSKGNDYLSGSDQKKSASSDERTVVFYLVCTSNIPTSIKIGCEIRPIADPENGKDRIVKGSVNTGSPSDELKTRVPKTFNFSDIALNHTLQPDKLFAGDYFTSFLEKEHPIKGTILNDSVDLYHVQVTGFTPTAVTFCRDLNNKNENVSDSRKDAKYSKFISYRTQGMYRQFINFVDNTYSHSTESNHQTDFWVPHDVPNDLWQDSLSIKSSVHDITKGVCIIKYNMTWGHDTAYTYQYPDFDNSFTLWDVYGNSVSISVNVNSSGSITFNII